MNRSQLEAILKINGVSLTAPESQIRSTLLSARYSEDEVDAAISVLKEDVAVKKSRVDGLHKVFRSDDSLKPNEISQLLGIDIEVDQLPEKKEKSRELSLIYLVSIVVFSILVATGATLLYMYFYELGPFHPSSSALLFNGL